MLTMPVEQIRKLKQSGGELEISIFLTPRRTLVADKILEEAGVLGDVNIEEFPLYFIPIEQDVLSMELQDSFKDLYLHKDTTVIFSAAKALMLMQQKHGLFPRIVGKGDGAHRLMELLLRMRGEASAGEPSAPGSLGFMPSADIECLIIIDREVDLLTPILNQLTYEGFVDELYGIKDNAAEIDTSVVGPAPGAQNKNQSAAPITSQHGLKRKIMLDSSDRLFMQLRDANFATVGGILNKVARKMQTEFGSGNIEAKSTAELKDFVKKLPGYQTEQQSLRIHTGLAEEITKYTKSEGFMRSLEVQQNLTQGVDPTSQHDTIEELISRDMPLMTVLRLLCIESAVAGGLKQKDLENFRTLIMHAYGQQHLLTLEALEKIGLLVPRAGGSLLGLPGTGGGVAAKPRTNYTYLRRALRLIMDEVNEVQPNDIAYVYSGYAPLSVRLVQCVVQKQQLFAAINKGAAPAGGNVSNAVIGWQGFEDALKAVKGQTFNKAQKGEAAATKARVTLSGSGGKKTAVVMFLGGITRTEIAALRFLGSQEGKTRILICTTEIISGNKIMEAAIEKRTFKA